MYERWNDAESINRHFDDTLWLRRAHSVGARRHSGIGLVLLVGVNVVSVVLFVRVYRMTNPIEQQWMSDVLAPEVAAGVITDDELDVLVGTLKHRRRFVKSQDDHHERRVEKHVIEAAHDLADQIAADRGADTDAVQHARSEVVRLRT